MNWQTLLIQEYQQRYVWITGAGQGIGQQVARLFHQLGSYVIGFDRAFSDVSYLTEAVTLDLNDSTAIDQCLAALLQQNKAPYNLINVAGVLELNPLDQLTLAQWQHSQQVNCQAVFQFIKACSAHFKAQGNGSIITVSSNAAKTPRCQMAAYAAAKAAVSQLTLTAGLELAAFGVRCNVVSPGSTLTAMQTKMWQNNDGAAAVIAGDPAQYRLGIPLQKIATPLEIANSVLFLASSLSAHTTLQVLTIDGGATF